MAMTFQLVIRHAKRSYLAQDGILHILLILPLRYFLTPTTSSHFPLLISGQASVKDYVKKDSWGGGCKGTK